MLAPSLRAGVIVADVEKVQRVPVARGIHEAAREGEVLRLNWVVVPGRRGQEQLLDVLRDAALRVLRRGLRVRGQWRGRNGTGR